MKKTNRVGKVKLPSEQQPISYYGGKQMMLKHILPNIPAHKTYTEAFFGGGAVFWAKEPSRLEVINDYNAEIVNIYQVIKSHPEKLKKLINCTPSSRLVHNYAQFIYENPAIFSRVRRAWALWLLANNSYSSLIDGGWAYAKLDNQPEKKLHNKRLVDLNIFSNRLERVQIENNNAIKIIKSRDYEDAFHYVDPPYFNSNMGHYKGYSINDFKELLETLSNIKGKFMLSSYQSDILKEYTKANGWYTKEIKMKIAVTNKTNKSKVEVITTNYKI